MSRIPSAAGFGRLRRTPIRRWATIAAPAGRRRDLSAASGSGAIAHVALTEVDRNLLRRCLAKDPGAWKDFVDRFVGLFVHVINNTAHARSIPLSADDLDDMCAEVFVVLLANDFAVLRRFRGKSSLATYLAVVARRIVAREMAKRRKAEALGHVSAHQASLNQANATSPEHQRIENRELVQRMLSGLTVTDAEVVKQFHLEGKSYREISTHLGIPENSIGPTLTRAREKMRAEAQK